MATGKTGPANAYSKALNDEIRALMGRRRFSQTSLAEATGISQAQISKIIFHNRAPLNTNQLDVIARALGESPLEILRRAQQAMEAAGPDEPNAVTRAVVPQKRGDYALAAEDEPDEIDAEEEDYL
jgi:transcriptional regulator with XRE-family HTH domain